jgi:hypothetical protein
MQEFLTLQMARMMMDERVEKREKTDWMIISQLTIRYQVWKIFTIFISFTSSFTYSFMAAFLE